MVEEMRMLSLIFSVRPSGGGFFLDAALIGDRQANVAMCNARFFLAFGGNLPIEPLS
jgi:hypothetical protein